MPLGENREDSYVPEYDAEGRIDAAPALLF